MSDLCVNELCILLILIQSVHEAAANSCKDIWQCGVKV